MDRISIFVEMDQSENNGKEIVADNIYHVELSCVELSSDKLSNGELATASYLMARCHSELAVTSCLRPVELYMFI